MDLNAPHKLFVTLLFLSYAMCSANACEEDANKSIIEKHQAATGNSIEEGKGIGEYGSDKSNVEGDELFSKWEYCARV